MDIGGIVILFFQCETAVVSQALAALRIAVAPESASYILVDVGTVAHECRQIVPQVIKTVIARLP